MALHGTDQREVVEAAQKKAAHRGRFETVAWLTTAD
jgi:hypothetical protein